MLGIYFNRDTLPKSLNLVKGRNVLLKEEISVSDETVADTLTDLAIYAFITGILYEDFKKCNI